MRHTIGEMVKFITDHRRNKVFRHWTAEEIVSAIKDAIERNGFSYCIDSKGAINGVVMGWPNHEEKVFYVSNILATEHGVMKAFIKHFGKLYAGYNIEATRHDRIRHYRTERLIKLILNTN